MKYIECRKCGSRFESTTLKDKCCFCNSYLLKEIVFKLIVSIKKERQYEFKNKKSWTIKNLTRETIMKKLKMSEEYFMGGLEKQCLGTDDLYNYDIEYDEDTDKKVQADFYAQHTWKKLRGEK